MDDSSLLTIAKAAQGKIASDPEVALSQFGIAKRNLAFRCIESDFNAAIHHLLDLVRFHLELWHVAGLPPCPEDQNLAMLVAITANEMSLAKEIATIEPPPNQSHRFDLRLNAALRTVLGVKVAFSYTSYRPTTSEVSLFDALENLNDSKSDVSNYWRATRRRRYALTVFEKFDFFSAAVTRLKEVSSVSVGVGGVKSS